MSVAAIGHSNGSPRSLDRNRPAAIEVKRLPMNSDISTSLGVIRQTTISNSLGDESPRVDTQRSSHQYHYEVPNLSSMLYEYTHKERDRV